MLKEISKLPKVTIMIPTYGQEEIILEAVDSALAQDYPNLEVVVADDASPDGTAVVVATRKDKRLRYHRNERNLGRVGNYRNTLYNLATGDWVINLDGDDYYTDTGFISAVMEVVINNPEVIIVSARRVSKSAKREFVTEIPKHRLINGRELLLNLHKTEFRFWHMVTLYRRSEALECDFYRADVISADWESLFRLALRGKIAYIDRIAGVWRCHEDNASTEPDSDALLENLKIWDAIYDEAALFGIPSYRAKWEKQKIRVIIGYYYYSLILKKKGIKEAVNYIISLYKIDWLLPLSILLYYKTIIKAIVS
jgi:glycosyltransferase involved in cell wall biosynthesis